MNLTRNNVSADVLKSKAVFEEIAKMVKDNPEKAKSLSGVFAYRITKDGKVVSHWSKYFMLTH